MKAAWARAPSGWAEPVTLTDEQRDVIRRELSSRRLAVFKDADRQDALLKQIEGALTYLQTREGVKPDPHRAQDRVEALRKALVEAEKAMRDLGQPERAAIEHGRIGQLAAFAQDVVQVREQAESALDALKMPRSPHDPSPGGQARFLIHHIAVGWHRIFERAPSAKEDGPFFNVANIALGQTGRPEVGTDALRAILKGWAYQG